MVRRDSRLQDTVLAIALLVCMTGAAGAQSIPEGYQEGTHIVREGDTLRGLTIAYLGSEDLWRTNWELNPHVKDPDFLYPLQRLRILLAPEQSRPTARLVTISGDVEGKPAPSDWNRSIEDDLMLERDGIRANKDASTVMEFSDGTELTLKDDSTMFLRVAGRSLRGGEKRSVEIVEGQADLVAATLAQETNIEIIIGGAVTKPKTGETGRMEARARRVEGGGARVMVFEGLGEVEAAGAVVMVETGMGTAVPEAGPPAPPEELLPAVEGLLPATGGEFELERSRFSWTAVENAVSYTVEVCRDETCGNLVRRQTGVSDTSWTADDLPVGPATWRVMAVSASGLDGFPSETQAVSVLANRKDYNPPTGEFIVSGTSIDVDEMTYYGPDLSVRLEANDAGTGIESVALMIDGSEVAAETLLGPWPTGDYEVTAVVGDHSGNSSSFGPLEFHVDADPPVVDWKVGGEELLAGHPAGGEVPRRWGKIRRKWSKRELADFRRGRPNPKWTVVSWSSALPSAAGRLSPEAISTQRSHKWFSLERLDAQVVVFAPALALESADDRLADRLLSIETADDRSGQERFRIWRRPGPDSRHWLEIDVVDRLGNRAIKRWPFPRAD